MTAIPQFVLFRHLSTVGSPRRDIKTGALIAPGEDLGAPGVTEWCFDVIYVTWACLVGSSLLGEFVWWLYLSVRRYWLLTGPGLVSSNFDARYPPPDSSICSLEIMDCYYWSNDGLQ